MGRRRHPCPVTLPGGQPCGAMVGEHLLMDPPHWRLVAPALQTRVYATYARGSYPYGRAAHDDACADAVADVEEQLLALASQPVPGRR